MRRPRWRPRWQGLAALVLVAAATTAAAAGQAPPEPLDLLVRGGRLLDGTGNPWRRADVGVRGDRIVAVGRLEGVAAREVLDARGLYVLPGFIDVHSHAGGGLARPELREARPLLAQGVTTVIVNPDGGGPVDLAAQRATYERQGIGVNVGLLVGHGSVRRAVLGMADRAASAEELAAMEDLVRRARAAGALGLSSGLYYAPGSYASTEELVALARLFAPEGVYASHIRDEGDYSVGLLAAVEEVVAIAEGADVEGVVTHFKALGPASWGLARAACLRIERARARGVRVWADQYPYAASGTSIVGALVPRWALAGEGADRDAHLARVLAEPAERARLREAMAENIERRGGAATLLVSRFAERPALEGKTLAEIAADRGIEPVDAALEILEAGGAGLVSFNMSEEDVEEILRREYVMTSSDGGLVPFGEGRPHPRFYGTFPRKIRRYVLERRTIGLAHAVRSMTSLSARVFGLDDRGLVRPGAAADLVVVDLARLRDRATYEDPHRLAEGVVHVVVNGRIARRDERFTGVLAGRVLVRAR